MASVSLDMVLMWPEKVTIVTKNVHATVRKVFNF